MTTNPYVVVPAPGHYGDAARIISTHRTREAARRAAARASRRGACRYVARQHWGRTSGPWLRVYEQSAPIV